MNASRTTFGGSIAFAIVLLIFAASDARTQVGKKPTRADFDRLSKELSNWGRWGQDDQLGTLNLITAEKRKQAVSLVKEGVNVSLARDLNTERSAQNPDPLVLKTLTVFGSIAVDSLSISYHGFAHTHVDALCHVFPGGKMYNGFGSDLVAPTGVAKDSIHNLKGGVLAPGILIDIPNLKRVPYLEPGTPIDPEDLDAWEKHTGIRVGAGDIVFVRTGRWAREKAKGPWELSKSAAGLDVSCLKWIRARDIAMLGSDAASDLIPSPVPGVFAPIHEVAIAAIGVHLIDNCDLEALSETAQKYRRWEFLVTIAPLAIVGGTGSPVNPIATF